jgi:hypothetical protein
MDSSRRGVAGFNLRDFSTDVSEAYDAYEAYQTSVEKPKIRVRKNIFKEIARGVGSMPIMKKQSVREGFTNSASPYSQAQENPSHYPIRQGNGDLDGVSILYDSRISASGILLANSKNASTQTTPRMYIGFFAQFAKMYNPSAPSQVLVAIYSREKASFDVGGMGYINTPKYLFYVNIAIDSTVPITNDEYNLYNIAYYSGIVEDSNNLLFNNDYQYCINTSYGPGWLTIQSQSSWNPPPPITYSSPTSFEAMAIGSNRIHIQWVIPQINSSLPKDSFTITMSPSCTSCTTSPDTMNANGSVTTKYNNQDYFNVPANQTYTFTLTGKSGTSLTTTATAAPPAPVTSSAATPATSASGSASGSASTPATTSTPTPTPTPTQTQTQTPASAQQETPGPAGNQCRKTTDVHYTKAEGVAAQIMNAYNELCNGGQAFSCKQVLTGSLYCPNFPGDFPAITSVTRSSITWGITNPGLGYPPYYEIYIYKDGSKVKTYTLGQNNNQPVNQRTFSSVQTSDFNYLSGQTYTIIVSAFYNTLSGTYDSAPFTYVVPSSGTSVTGGLPGITGTGASATGTGAGSVTGTGVTATGTGVTGTGATGTGVTGTGVTATGTGASVTGTGSGSVTGTGVTGSGATGTGVTATGTGGTGTGGTGTGGTGTGGTGTGGTGTGATGTGGTGTGATGTGVTGTGVTGTGLTTTGTGLPGTGLTTTVTGGLPGMQGTQGTQDVRTIAVPTNNVNTDGGAGGTGGTGAIGGSPGMYSVTESPGQLVYDAPATPPEPPTKSLSPNNQSTKTSTKTYIIYIIIFIALAAIIYYATGANADIVATARATVNTVSNGIININPR